MFERRHRVKAFTLLELLSVVAILTLLLCMLFPYLNRTRELARRAVCASNLKTLSAAMLIYTSNNAGRIPLSCLDTRNDATGEGSICRQFDYLVMWELDHYPNPDMAYGLLLREMSNGRTDSRQVFKGFYCPSQTAPIFRYDNWINPWLPPPWDPRYNLHTYTRVGYGTRPLVGWNPYTRSVHMGWPDPTVQDLPRYQRLDPAMAIVSDIVTDMEYTASSHVDGPKFSENSVLADFARPTGGVNFATAGGAVLWFQTVNFNSNWQKWGQQTLSAIVNNNTGFNDYPWGDPHPETGYYQQGATPFTGTGAWFDMDKKGGY